MRCGQAFKTRIGPGLFVGSAVGKVMLGKLIRQVRPFVVMGFAVVLIITCVPFLTTTLARALLDALAISGPPLTATFFRR